jgi:hypothetical protein
MDRNDAAHAEEDAAMARWLALPLVVLPFIAAGASGAAPRDRDRDGLPDRWERRHHLSTSKNSAKGDPDRDGLRNQREYQLRTNPRRKDTDRDGLRDRAEVRRYITNPRKRDTDGDGYGDGVEVRAGTNPRNPRSHPSGSVTPTPTPTPSPSPTPTPSPSPGGFPDASNTGVPPGTVLTPSGGMTINTAGAVIDAREITGQVVVNASNVTIRRSRIRSNAMYVIDNSSTGLVVEDSEIINRPVSGQNNCHNGIGDSNYTVVRTEITGCENAANIGGDNVTFADNYIHDLDTTGPSYVWGNDPHTDGLQMSPGADNIVVRHNWIDPSSGSGVTSPIIMGVNGSQSNVRIEDNYLDGRGAAYAVYANRQPSTGIFINRNQMHRAAYGYTACVRVGITVTEFNNNRDAATGALLSPDNGAGGSCTN